MKPALEVVAAGLHTSLQDLGRFGSQRIGVPVSGALDAVSLRLANALVGNSQDTAALEILYHGPTLAVHADSLRIALAGGGVQIEVLGDYRRSIPAWRSARLQRGEIFQVGALNHCACCYLAVEGGFAIAPWLGSRSTYTRGLLGGFEGRALREGDLVPLALSKAGVRAESELPSPPPDGRGQSIRVVLGPQHDYFTLKSLTTFLTSDYIVNASADRMGIRLDGPLLKHNRKGYDIASDAIVTGAIQVPGSGQPIILLADHQITGGYPKIATVISADLPILGRRAPGDTIRFTAVRPQRAEQIRREHEAALQELIRTIRPVPAGKDLDLESLYHQNLISGVISADD
jgi:biotin-dependent carboxylase-like uncharacterized protein